MPNTKRDITSERIERLMKVWCVFVWRETRERGMYEWGGGGLGLGNIKRLFFLIKNAQLAPQVSSYQDLVESYLRITLYNDNTSPSCGKVNQFNFVCLYVC
ncbi:hypothetical protein HanIR_Chr11g0520041 [Helianthus annuus]|nr:hypothetical protein HanIR_Chr11g0520041 [Helianthus annuus]